MNQAPTAGTLTKRLIVDMNKCTGCTACVLACSSIRMGVFSPSYARTRVLKLEASGVDAPVFCQQCEVPRCMEACPRNAIVRQPDTGIIEIDAKLCDRCLACAVACPYGAVSATPENRKTRTILKCDLCHGNPSCIAWCDTKAIQYVDVSETELIKQARENMLMIKQRFEIEQRTPLWRHFTRIPKGGREL